MNGFFLIIILLLLPASVFGFTVFIAPVEYAPVDFSNTVVTELNGRFLTAQVDFKLLTAEAPKSFLDAMRICNENDIDFLIYGFVEERERFLYGELKLFERENRKVVKDFYGGDNRDMALRLAEDLASKIEVYFRELLNLPEESAHHNTPTEGILSFALGGGYFLPLSSDWGNFLQPLYSLDFQIGFTPWKPAPGSGFRGFYFKSGLTGGFFYSLSREGFQESELFYITAGIPFSLSADFGIRHSLGISVTPRFSLDYAIIQLLYSDTEKLVNYHFSCSGELEYQFHFSGHVSLRVGNRVTASFINPIRLFYNPFLLLEFNLNPMSGGSL